MMTKFTVQSRGFGLPVSVVCSCCRCFQYLFSSDPLLGFYNVVNTSGHLYSVLKLSGPSCQPVHIFWGIGVSFAHTTSLSCTTKISVTRGSTFVLKLPNWSTFLLSSYTFRDAKPVALRNPPSLLVFFFHLSLHVFTCLYLSSP